MARLAARGHPILGFKVFCSSSRFLCAVKARCGKQLQKFFARRLALPQESG